MIHVRSSPQSMMLTHVFLSTFFNAKHNFEWNCTSSLRLERQERPFRVWRVHKFDGKFERLAISRCVYIQPPFRWLMVAVCSLWFYFWAIRCTDDNHNYSTLPNLPNYDTKCSWL
jgi:hypothetical protein